MTDPDVTIRIAPAGDVMVLDMWTGAEPDLTGIHVLKVEPRRWWMLDAGDKIRALEQAIGDNGALTPIGGGLMRATLSGAGWRSQLMISGVFDAENRDFKPGDCAATPIHHANVWIAVISEAEAHVYFAASLRGDMEHLWGL